MDFRYSAYCVVRAAILLVVGCLLLPSHGWGLDASQPAPVERREVVSLADAAVRALQHNLDITISRHMKESRLADIIIEQSKFDPNLSLNGQYNRTVNPLNRLIFGGTGGALNQITLFDQRTHAVTVDANTNLITGGNIDVNYSPQRASINQSVAEGFLFNPAWTGGLAFTITQPLLRNAGVAINKTFITIAQNNAVVEQHVFHDRVMTVVASVEQTYWELVFANENLKVAQAALKAAEELLATNRAKAKAGVMTLVDVLQAETAVASRVEQTLLAGKAIRNQEDQLRRLLNPGEEDLQQDVRLVPSDGPATVLEPLSLQEVIDTAIAQRPEMTQAKNRSNPVSSTSSSPVTSSSRPSRCKARSASPVWGETTVSRLPGTLMGTSTIMARALASAIRWATEPLSARTINANSKPRMPKWRSPTSVSRSSSVCAKLSAECRPTLSGSRPLARPGSWLRSSSKPSWNG